MALFTQSSGAGSKKHRIGKKLKAVEATFAALPKKHRTEVCFMAIAKAHGVPEATARSHFQLALSLMERE